MTSIEVPRRIAATLPSLSVLDITDEVEKKVLANPLRSGIAFLSATGSEPCFIRVNERETGFFEDLEALLARLVPFEAADRERMLCFLLGPTTEQVPFHNGRLTLGRYQRIMLFGFAASSRGDWNLTILGA
jgi:thiamine phosphate synthase YjbQ (UPF0047 family)